MKKKILIGVAAVVALLLGAGFYLNYRNQSLSPAGSTELASGDLKVAIEYSRPSVRGRLIFGDKEKNALQPYGQYWRLGANEATQITFNKDVLFNGNPVKAGTYRMYAFPGPDTFELGLNAELGKWGYTEPDYSQDILRTKVPVEKRNSSLEQYTITMREAAPQAIDVIFEWSDVRFVLPIKAQQ